MSNSEFTWNKIDFGSEVNLVGDYWLKFWKEGGIRKHECIMSVELRPNLIQEEDDTLVFEGGEEPVEVFTPKKVNKVALYKYSDTSSNVYVNFEELFNIKDVREVLPSNMRKILAQLRDNWDSVFSKDGNLPNLHPQGRPVCVNFSDERITEIEAFLRDENKFELIKQELERTYAGQESAKMYTFLKGLQAYVPAYPQAQAVGSTAVGKTGMILAVFALFPDGHVQLIDEFSPTALRRDETLKEARIIVLMQAEGAGKKYQLLMISRDDNTGATCRITDPETGKVVFWDLPRCMMITSSIDLFLQSEHNSRTDRIFLDESVEQNRIGGRKIAGRWSEDNEVKEALGKLEPSIQGLIKDAVDLYSREIWTMNCPYALYVEEVMDGEKKRYKRDIDSIMGCIDGVTNFNKYNREFYILETDGEPIIRILAHPDDFELVMKYADTHITQTYYDIPAKYSEVVGLVNKLSESNYMSGGFVHIKQIEQEAEKKGISRSEIQKQLKFLIDNTRYIEREKSYERDEHGIIRQDNSGNFIAKSGYSYKFVVEVPESVFKRKPVYDEMLEIYETYQQTKESEGCLIFDYDGLKAYLAKNIHTQASPVDGDIGDREAEVEDV